MSVRLTPGYFALTNQKILAVDGKTGSSMTFDFTPQYYASSRDFGIADNATNMTSQPSKQRSIATGRIKKLRRQVLWRPGSEPATLHIINSAKTSLKIYNEEMADRQVVSAFGAATLRDIDARIVMTDQSSWRRSFTKLQATGVHIRTFSAKPPIVYLREDDCYRSHEYLCRLGKLLVHFTRTQSRTWAHYYRQDNTATT